MGKYVVVDLEMCMVPWRMRRDFPWKQEIIQIGAVLLDEDYRIAGEFSTYVRPEHGHIDAFIRRLTGISGHDVKDAPELDAAIEKFMAWLPAEGVIGVSWSRSDELQFRKEMGAKGIRSARLETMLGEWVDCQPMFGKITGMKRECALEEALVAADIFNDGRAHDGLVDARNTACLFAKMKTEKDFSLNPYYASARGLSEPEHLTSSIGDILSGLSFDMPVPA